MFELGGVDITLGVAWLATLETVQVNWEESSMVFFTQGVGN